MQLTSYTYVSHQTLQIPVEPCLLVLFMMTIDFSLQQTQHDDYEVVRDIFDAIVTTG